MQLPVTQIIPVIRPQLPTLQQLLPYLRRIDESDGQYSNGGPLVQELETQMAAYLRTPTVTVANATLGLELALQACGLRRKRILIPALTFRATATAVTRTGNYLVLGDVDDVTWQLTPAIAEKHRGRFDAVIPVAAYGRPVETAPWEEFEKEHAVPVILDAAAAFGRQGAGLLTAAVFSLHATKTLAAGEGGLVTSRSWEIVHRVQQLANFEEAAATNAKMSEYHAAVALAMYDQWADIVSRRVELRTYYAQSLRQSLYKEKYSLQDWPEGSPPTYMMVRLHGRDAKEIGHLMRDHGIETKRWYCPTVDQWMGKASTGLEVTQVLRDELLGLPFYVGMTDEHIDLVCETLREVL